MDSLGICYMCVSVCVCESEPIPVSTHHLQSIHHTSNTNKCGVHGVEIHIIYYT